MLLSVVKKPPNIVPAWLVANSRDARGPLHGLFGHHPVVTQAAKVEHGKEDQQEQRDADRQFDNGGAILVAAEPANDMSDRETHTPYTLDSSPITVVMLGISGLPFSSRIRPKGNVISIVAKTITIGTSA